MFSSVKFLHFADVHINNDTSGRMVELEGGQLVGFRVSDILKNFDTMIDNAIKYGVNYAFFAGDMYRNHLPANLYRSLVGDRLQKLADANVKVIIVVGNHDSNKREHAFLEVKSWGTKNIFVIDHPCHIEFDDLVVTGIPWQFDEFTYQHYLHPDKPNVAIAHCTINEVLFGTEQYEGEIILGREFRLPINYFDGFDYVALGHIHKQLAWDNVVYPGSMEQLTWGEFKDGSTHGYVLGTLGENWTLYPYQTRPRYDLEINLNEKVELPEVNPDAMYRITLIGNNVLKETGYIMKHFQNAISLKIRTIKENTSPKYKTIPPMLNEQDPTSILAAYFRTTKIPFDKELKELWTEILDTTG